MIISKKEGTGKIFKAAFTENFLTVMIQTKSHMHETQRTLYNKD